MEFEDELEGKFFRIQAVMITANAGLSPFRARPAQVAGCTEAASLPLEVIGG